MHEAHYNYGHRFYSPGLGRWVSRDPIGAAGGRNLFVFVGNGPILGFDPHGLKIKWKRLPGEEVDQAYLRHYEAMQKKPDPWIRGQIQRRQGIEVWYEGDCTCKKSNAPDGTPLKGAVVLVQYKDVGWFRSKWAPDGGGAPRTEKDQHGNPIVRQPAYLDPDPKTGDTGVGGSIPGSYIDSPTKDQTLKVEAWCRCPCEDDFLMDGETTYIRYTKHGDITSGKSP